MKTITFHCDLCGKEFSPESFCFINGQTIKVDAELKPQRMVFEGHYCGACADMVLLKIDEIKNAQHTDTKSVDK